MPQWINRSDARRLASQGVLALSTVGIVATTGTAAEANVLIYSSGLTTSLNPENFEVNTENVFFSFTAGTSSKDPGSAYQYRLFNNSTGVRIVGSSPTNLISQNSNCQAIRYNRGDSIGPDSLFDDQIADISSSFRAPFQSGQTGYIGFAFEGSSGVNYGWANITVTLDDTKNVTLNQFAYETTPNLAIIAAPVPEANPLLLLVLGATGLGAYRLARGKDETAPTA